MVTEGNGLPLAFVVTAANVSEVAVSGSSPAKAS
jgi:hypothetical protein